MEILSPQNPLIKQIRKAVARGGLTDDGLAVAEGVHVLEEASSAGCVVEDVLVSESAFDKFDLPDARVVSDSVFRDLSSTETPQGVLALVRPRAFSLDQIVTGTALVVVLDGVQDPGNAGAIIRAAEAFGATGLIFLKGTVNAFNPKCIRGSAGSVFRIPLVTGVTEDVLLASGISLYAAMPHAEKLLSDVDFTSACAIVIGSEGRGVSDSLAACAQGFRIPTSHVESLNAAVAAGVILYQASRQRGKS